MGVIMSGHVFPDINTFSQPLLVQGSEENKVLMISTGSPDQEYGALVTSRPAQNKLVCFNVGGKKFFTIKKNLSRYPGTRIAALMRASSLTEILENCDDYQPGDIPEYFFNRSCIGFNDILDVYRIGHLHLNSGGLCAMRVKAMIEYWRLDELLLDPCCAMKYYNDVKTCVMEIEDHLDTTRDYKMTLEAEDFGNSLPSKIRKFLWDLTEYPESSRYAKIFSFLSMSIVIGSIINLILTSSVKQLIPEVEVSNSTGQGAPMEKWENAILVLRILDHTFNWFFITEYMVRIICCPRKFRFFFKPLNLVDLFAILPYFLGLFIGDFVGTNLLARLGRVLRLIRIIRVLRVFRFIRHFPALQTLISTIFNTAIELGLLAFMIVLAASVLGSFLFFSEKDSDNQGMFVESAWWMLAVISSSGGGENKPSSIPGKILGIISILFGVFILTLPLPILMTSFAVKYKQVLMTNQMKTMKKERKETGRKTTVVENINSVNYKDCVEKTNGKALTEEAMLPSNNFFTARARPEDYRQQYLSNRIQLLTNKKE